MTIAIGNVICIFRYKPDTQFWMEYGITHVGQLFITLPKNGVTIVQLRMYNTTQVNKWS